MTDNLKVLKCMYNGNCYARGHASYTTTTFKISMEVGPLQAADTTYNDMVEIELSGDVPPNLKFTFPSVSF
jgi:hypothetical protein